MSLELVKYCSFGYQCPVALVAVNQSTQAYTVDGVKSLIKKFASDNDSVVILQSILNRLEQLKDIEIDEISWDDISGQDNLF